MRHRNKCPDEPDLMTGLNAVLIRHRLGLDKNVDQEKERIKQDMATKRRTAEQKRNALKQANARATTPKVTKIEPTKIASPKQQRENIASALGQVRMSVDRLADRFDLQFAPQPAGVEEQEDLSEVLTGSIKLITTERLNDIDDHFKAIEARISDERALMLKMIDELQAMVSCVSANFDNHRIDAYKKMAEAASIDVVERLEARLTQLEKIASTPDPLIDRLAVLEGIVNQTVLPSIMPGRNPSPLSLQALSKRIDELEKTDTTPPQATAKFVDVFYPEGVTHAMYRDYPCDRLVGRCACGCLHRPNDVEISADYSGLLAGHIKRFRK